MDADKFKEAECKEMLKQCYLKSKHKIGFKTIAQLAIGKGFTHKDLVWGVPKATSN